MVLGEIKPVPLHGSEQNDVSDLTMPPDFAGSDLSDGLWQITDKNVEDGSPVWPVCHKVCFQGGFSGSRLRLGILDTVLKIWQRGCISFYCISFVCLHKFFLLHK